MSRLAPATVEIAPGEDGDINFVPNGAPNNITGWAIGMTVRPDWRSDDTTPALFELTVGNGITITDGPADLYYARILKANSILLFGLEAPVADVWREDAGSRRQLRRIIFSVVDEAWKPV